MELLSSAAGHHAVPEKYIFPPEKRPGNELVDPSVVLPVIDLRGGGGGCGDRGRIVEEIMQAGREFGFFQVVNHGVPEQVTGGMMAAAEEFFKMPAEEKAPYCSDDQSKAFRVSSSTSYDKSETRYWRDYMKLKCYPVDQFINQWPEKPQKFRECLAKYIVAVQAVATTILKLIAEGLGLDEHYFRGDLSGGETEMNVNYYPPCPDPSLTLGLLPHCDRHMITILAQGTATRGLQIKYKGGWIGVQPIPDAFVVNFGHQLEIVTNGLLKSVEHRAVTNLAVPRMSVATLIMPRMDCRVAPAPELLTEQNPAKYKPFIFKDFLSAYAAASANRESVLEYFKI